MADAFEMGKGLWIYKMVKFAIIVKLVSPRHILGVLRVYLQVTLTLHVTLTLNRDLHSQDGDANSNGDYEVLECSFRC